MPEVINIFNKRQRSDADDVIKKLRKQLETDEAFPDQYSLTEGKREQNGIYLPITLKVSKHLETGDTVTLKLFGQMTKYRIAGFFEDPFLGSTMTGFIQLFLDRETYEKLSATTKAVNYQSTMVSL